jgi:hypothetical protein
MNRAELIEIIRSKGIMPEGSREDYEAMISQYPWFHSGYSLMLSNLYQRGDLSFDEILKSCSVNIADREVLYYMLNRTSGHAAPADLSADVRETDRQLLSDVVSNDNRSEQSASSDKPEGDSYAEIAIRDEGEKPEQEPRVLNAESKSEDITVSGRSREELLFEIEKRLSEIEEKSRREDLLILGEESVSADTDSTEELSDTGADQADRDNLIQSDLKEELSDTGADQTGRENRNQSDQGGADDIEIVSDADEVSKESPLFDSSLLDLDYSSGSYQLPDPDKKKEERETGGESRVTEQESESGDESDFDLINRFLEKKPRISPAREADDKNYHDLAENQGEPPDLISETLARIYMSQKYYSKAIHIYEKLCLKYPEKSGYFATQIEKIKELMS